MRIEEENEKLEHEQQKFNAQIKILQQSLKNTEDSIGAVGREIKENQEQMHIIEESIMKIHIQTSKLYDEVIVKIKWKLAKAVWHSKCSHCGIILEIKRDYDIAL